MYAAARTAALWFVEHWFLLSWREPEFPAPYYLKPVT
jgi:hypothetical protein